MKKGDLDYNSNRIALKLVCDCRHDKEITTLTFFDPYVTDVLYAAHCYRSYQPSYTENDKFPTLTLEGKIFISIIQDTSVHVISFSISPIPFAFCNFFIIPGVSGRRVNILGGGNMDYSE